MPTLNKVYSRFGCHDCEEVKYFLSQKGIEFEEVNFDKISADEANKVIDESGLASLPIVFLNGKYYSKYDYEEAL